MAKFPAVEWLDELVNKLNTDEKYAKVAHAWEGDMTVVVEKGGNLSEPIRFYLDLWHGKCRSGRVLSEGEQEKSTFTLTLPYENGVHLLKGELEPMQAMLTRKISVQGNMAVLMRNVPTVLDFVRCCREITDSFI
jgi:putative sterol carrier protein